jgi:hypothetical protein
VAASASCIMCQTGNCSKLEICHDLITP